MNSNKEYLDFSIKNPDANIDFSKPEGKIVINRGGNEAKTQLVNANEKLIELIATYKTIRDDESFSDQSKNSIIKKIIDIVEKTKLINYSPFCQYFQVLGYSYYAYMTDEKMLSLEEKIGLMRNIVDCYVDNRHDMYTYHGYSNQSLQVVADSASSRRNGVTGPKRIAEYLDSKGFKHVHTIDDFSRQSMCYLFSDKEDKDTFISILTLRKISFDFQKNNQNKFPDLLIKIHNDLLIVEQKDTNGSGGSQNHTIGEIINFINEQEDNLSIHYVSCLGGNYLKLLSGKAENSKTKKNGNKEKVQLNDIRNHLNNCHSNYFVNENGFKKLLSDLVEEYG